MKSKNESSLRKSTGALGAPDAKQPGSGGGAGRTGAPIEARFKAVFECSRDAIGVSKAGIHAFVNPAYLELFGFPAGTDLAGKPVLDLIAAENRDQVKSYIYRCAQRETVPAAYETRGLRTDGAEFDLEVSVSFYQEDGEDHTLVILRDITERKRDEKALRESEERFRALVETSYDWVWAVDENGIYTYASPRVKDILGYAPEDVVGKTPFDLMPPKERERIAGEFMKTVAKRAPLVELENINLRKDGREVILETSGMPVIDREGVFRGYRGIDRDVTERKLAEAVLRTSEERFRKAFLTSPDAININRLRDGMYISVNQGFTAITGYSAADVIGRTSLELSLWVDPADRQKLVEELRKQGDVKNLETAFRTKDGRIIDGLMSASIIEIDHIPYIISISRDITERKQSELALKLSEGKYRRLYNETPVLLHSIDRNGIAVDVNDYWLKTMGYERSEVIGRKITDFYTGASRRYAEETVQPAFFRDGVVKDISFQFVRKNGDVLDVLLSATGERDAAGSVVRSQAVIVDITERKRAEEALRQSEERFKAITMTASDAILLMDDRGAIVHWNPAAERMFGYSSAEAVGKDLHLFLAPRRLHKNYLRGFGNFVMTGQGPVINRSVEMSAMKRDGGEFPIEISTSAMNIEGRWHALGIVRDVTERKRLEQEILKSQKLESLGTLAGGIAHDFNNLLQGVFGYISMAKLSFDQREKSLAMLEQAEKALHQSVNLTSQLLTFSKGGKPVKKAVDLRPVIENAVRFALSGSRNDASISIADDLRTAEIDEGQIGQVVQNIVLNADQAMPVGGMIRVSVRNAPAAAIVPRPDLQGDLVEISIRDQGTGIPPEHLTRIFDPYFTTKEKGSGLGLATCYSIIRNHGGVITVSSELGKGTTFTIYLPASGAPVEREQTSARFAAGKKGRILVMDDEQVVREVTGELIRSLGHDVDFADSGQTAITRYRTAMAEGRPFDIVILDLTVRGGMGGAEAINKLREIDPGIKAVVSSGYSDDATLPDYRSQGFRAFLKKPYNVEELRNTLHALLA